MNPFVVCWEAAGHQLSHLLDPVPCCSGGSGGGDRGLCVCVCVCVWRIGACYKDTCAVCHYIPTPLHCQAVSRSYDCA